MIDFENLPPRTTLTTQYSSRGVVFNSPLVIDYSGTGIPTFPHSPTKAIVQCFGVEFCTTPFVLTFSAPQRRVRVWAGYSGRLNGIMIVVLEARDARGTTVGKTRIVLEAGQSPQKPVEIVLADARITQAIVSSPESPGSALSIDDLEYEPGVAAQEVVVPDLTGLTPNAAAETLRLRSFSLGTVREVETEGFTNRTIFSQVPHFGTLAVPGKVVNVVIARIPKPAPLDTVPDLGKLTMDSVRSRLALAGLRLGQVTGVEPSNADSGLVFRQTPQPYALLPAGSPVDVAMVRSPPPPRRVRVPNLIDLTYRQAAESVSRAGLTLGGVRLINLRNADSGIVVRQSLPAQSIVPQRTSVDVVVTRRPLPPDGSKPILPIAAAIAVIAAASAWSRNRLRWRIRTKARDGLGTLVVSAQFDANSSAEFKLVPRIDPGQQQLKEEL